MEQVRTTEPSYRPGVFSRLFDAARKAVVAFGKSASDEIRSHPAETIAAATACGVMFALALRSNRQSRRRSVGRQEEASRRSTQPGDWNL
jgi:hypothetical protein